MRSKTAKKIRQAVKRDIRESFGDIAEIINGMPFLKRVKIAYRILRGIL